MLGRQTMSYFLSTLRQKIHTRRLIEDLCEYTGKSKTEVKNLFYNEALSEEAWAKANPVTEEEILRFYSESEEPMYTNLRWPSVDLTKFKSRFKLLSFCRQYNVKTVLDFGAGAGEYCLFLAQHGFNVTYCDVYGVIWKFSKWRFNRYGVSVHMLRAGQDKLGKYNLIICTDVLEHIKNPLKTLTQLHNSIEVNGFLCATFPFKVPKKQHLLENVKYAKIMENVLMEMGFKVLIEDYFRYYQKSK